MVLTFILHKNGGDVDEQEDRNMFNFNDLMTFGIFILASMTFIYMIS